jgi:uncharacterized Ntn-hydrolase superfamily protein
MKKSLFLFFVNFLFSTFSIVAIDQESGAVGSAGASCIEGSVIISDIYPGLGAVHTQSYWSSSNQELAGDLMIQGYSPSDIIDHLIQNDVSNNPSIRQYGIVSLQSIGSQDAFTGENCFDWKGHKVGNNYSIQGNILLSSNVLESMESNFLNFQGSFEQKLMHSLQGANIAGADTRCLEEGTSSISAFIRVANIDDLQSNLTIDLNVNYSPEGAEPIDSLKVLFDDWVFQNIEFDIGDINNDQTLDILDVVMLVAFVLDSSFIDFQQSLSSNLNGDIYLNIQDIIILINLILG